MKTRFSKPMPYNVDDMIKLYKDLHSGFWFNRATMRYWKCEILDDFRRIDDKTALFISSEPDITSYKLVRRYTVRKATLRVIDDEGRQKMDIDNVSPYCELSKHLAKNILADYKQD